jgi:hypothetical protein
MTHDELRHLGVLLQRDDSRGDAPAAEDIRAAAQTLHREVKRLQRMLREPLRRRPYPDSQLHFSVSGEGVQFGWENRESIYHVDYGGVVVSLNEAAWFARCFLASSYGRDALVQDFETGMYRSLVSELEAITGPMLERLRGFAERAGDRELPKPEEYALTEGPPLPHEYVSPCRDCQDGATTRGHTCRSCKGTGRLYQRSAPRAGDSGPVRREA